MKTETKIIKNPRVTEKASYALERNVYTFDVVGSANKSEIQKEIFKLYKVKPTKINITQVYAKKIFSRGTKGVKSGGKKAVIYLKKGDKIDLV